jgi:glyoxylase-like metal-dependent hydrolase (beta-lactamase superfamily II)
MKQVMNELEKRLNYPFNDAMPATGAAMQLAPGIKWLRMPLPFALNHINLWLLDDSYHGSDGVVKHGWAIVDCGVATPEIRAAWDTILATELDGKPITRVIVTHMHPDHVGNAKWLCDKLDVPLFMSMTDYSMARSMLAKPSGSGGVQAAAHFEIHGLAKGEDLDNITQRGNYYAGMVDGLPEQMHRLLGGQTLRIGAHDWQLDAGFGHAPEHISLYCAALNVVISGDMLLPRISTNISVWDMEPESNPLPLFLDSLSVYTRLPEDVLVLPSHGKPFRGAHERVAQLREHHADRLAELLQACTAAPLTGADAVKVLFKRDLDLHQMTFAMGEALAHLHALWFDGKVRRSKNAAGAWQFAV